MSISVVNKKALSMLESARNLYRKVAPLPDGRWRSHFDPKVYIALNKDLQIKNHMHAFRHFRHIGYRQLRPFSLLRPIDTAFYTAFYPDLVCFDPIAAYKHWLLHGIEEGRVQSLAALLEKLRYPSSRLPIEVLKYFENNYAEDAKKLAEIHQFLLEGKLPTLYQVAQICCIDALKELSSYFAQPQQKNVIYAIMLEKSPGNVDVLHANADRLMAQGDCYGALKMYMKACLLDGSSVWSYVNLSRLLAHFEDLDDAVNYGLIGLKKFKGSELLRDLLRSNLLARYDRAISRAKSTLIGGGDATLVRSDCEKAIEQLMTGLSYLHLDVSDKIFLDRKAVAIIGSMEPRQCYDYRIKQKIDHFQALGFRCKFFDWSNCKAFISEASSYSIVIFFRMPAFGNILEALYVAQKCGLRTVFEIDDLILDAKIYPPDYVRYGGLVGEAEMRALRFDPILFSLLASRCEFAIASTSVISDALGEIVLSRKSFVVENGLFVDEDPCKCASDDGPARMVAASRITLFYGSGSRSHSSAFSGALSNALVSVMAEFPNAEFTIVGPLALDERLGRSFGNRVRHFPQLLSRANYLRALCRSSINLLPLNSDEFSSAKSNIKWLEAASFGVPTVASDNITLRATTSEEEILLCSNEFDWKKHLTSLLNSEERRLDLGRRAKAAAHRRYAPVNIQEQMTAAIRGICPEPRHAVGRRVLMVNVAFTPQAYGGATRVVAEDARDLKARLNGELDVAVFTSWDGAADAESFRLYQEDGILICGVKAPASPQANETDFGVGEKFARFVELFKPDVIHFHCLQNLSASVVDVASLLDIPYVVTVHDGWWISDNQFLMLPDGRTVLEAGQWGDRNRLDRLRVCLEGAKVVFAVSDVFTNIYKQRTAANVVKLENLSRPLRVAKRPSSRAVRIGLIGGLGVAKGADLLHCVLRIKFFENLEFDVVDHLSSEGTVRVEYWGDNKVRILGRFSQDKVFRFYEEIDVLCAPSLCVESFGLSVREALNAGRWVIVSNRGALASAVDVGRNGFIIDVSEVVPLIEVLSKINDDSGTYKNQSSGFQGGADADARLQQMMTVYSSLFR